MNVESFVFLYVFYLAFLVFYVCKFDIIKKKPGIYIDQIKACTLTKKETKFKARKAEIPYFLVILPEI